MNILLTNDDGIRAPGLAALCDALAKTHDVTVVEYRQTHISSVFLTGSRVYKLKKPVNFGFLDFSTVELREKNCRAEVEPRGPRESRESSEGVVGACGVGSGPLSGPPPPSFSWSLGMVRA